MKITLLAAIKSFLPVEDNNERSKRKKECFILVYRQFSPQPDGGRVPEGPWRRQFEVKSAGTAPVGINPKSIEVMKEAGIDISAQSSDRLERQMIEEADYLITLCGDARDNCPVVAPEVERSHWPLEDPSHGEGTKEETLARFRRTRDLVKKYVEDLIAELNT